MKLIIISIGLGLLELIFWAIVIINGKKIYNRVMNDDK